MANPQPFVPICPYCGDPIMLEMSKTDEYGQAVHEDCYVRKMNQHLAAPAPVES